jgi:hypothetical protein
VSSQTWSEGIKCLGNHLQNTGYFAAGFWLLAMLGLPLAIFTRTVHRQLFFVILLWLFSLLGTATGFYFRPHYFVLMLPAAALMIGLTVRWLQQMLAFGPFKNVLKSLPLIVFGMTLGWFLFYQSLNLFQSSGVQVCQNLYAGNPFVESVAVGQYIREHSPPGARVAVVGSEPEIYFYARRHSATGYIYTYALMEKQPNAVKMRAEMIREIEAAAPAYLVYVSYPTSWDKNPDTDRALTNWVATYTSGHFEKIGVVGLVADGTPRSSWNAAAKINPTAAGQYLVVYRRNPDSAVAAPQP